VYRFGGSSAFLKPSSSPLIRHVFCRDSERSLLEIEIGWLPSCQQVQSHWTNLVDGTTIQLSRNLCSNLIQYFSGKQTTCNCSKSIRQTLHMTNVLTKIVCITTMKNIVEASLCWMLEKADYAICKHAYTFVHHLTEGD
jgi:hypothetical protein